MREIVNHINGEWRPPSSGRWLDVVNPATAEKIARVCLADKQDVADAVAASVAAFPAWRATPAPERVQPLFRLKVALEEHKEDLARATALDHGKTLADARGEVRRAIENVEVACGIPILMSGSNLEDVARGIDSDSIRQPLGVFAAITPFNFPMMVPCWFLPFAVACGNTFVLKPSEQTPLSTALLFDILAGVGFPPGVVNLINGAAEAVNALCEHPDVKGISFVGSAAVARHVYTLGTASGKRVQALGGAKNHLLVMPDADIPRTSAAVMGSAFGSAGERCLAGSVVVTVGEAHQRVVERLVEDARALRIGDGLDEQVDVGPLVSEAQRQRVEGYIETGIREGATLLLDGRNPELPPGLGGYFVGPTIFDDVTPDMTIAKEEIFGPVLAVVPTGSLDEGIAVVNRSRYGNASSIFTASGRAAREFKYAAQTGMVGVNVGVAAPMAFFTFTGWKDSFLGDLHAHGRDAIEFFTEKKVIISRWW